MDLICDILIDRAIIILNSKLGKPVNELIRMIMKTQTYKDLMDKETYLYSKSPECIAYLLEAEFEGDNQVLQAFWEAD